MESDTPVEALVDQRPRRCPTCGTPYPGGDDKLTCPVCQFRRLLEPEAAGDDEGRFDHYELETVKDGTFDELGRGAMGITYKAFDTVLENTVALKVIDARIASHPEARERFGRVLVDRLVGEARTRAGFPILHPRCA